MEVMGGPTFSIEVSAPAAYIRGRNGVAAQDKASAISAYPCLLSKNDDGGIVGRPRNGIGLGYGLGFSGQTAEYSSDSSSSIGAPGDSEDEDQSGEEDSVSSSKGDRVRGLGSLSSLEDSLPIKRGLSNHYKGKSKSFGSLSEVNTARVVEKSENPLNKRRRLLICSKLSRRSSFYSWQNPKSMPLLPVDEDDDDEERGTFNGDPKSSRSSSSDDEDTDKDKPKLRQRKLFRSAFKSRSCLSLADLQEERQ